MKAVCHLKNQTADMRKSKCAEIKRENPRKKEAEISPSLLPLRPLALCMGQASLLNQGICSPGEHGSTHSTRGCCDWWERVLLALCREKPKQQHPTANTHPMAKTPRLNNDKTGQLPVCSKKEEMGRSWEGAEINPERMAFTASALPTIQVTWNEGGKPAHSKEKGSQWRSVHCAS